MLQCMTYDVQYFVTNETAEYSRITKAKLQCNKTGRQFLANVNSSSCSLYVIDSPSVVCRLSVVCNVGAPYSRD